MDEIKRAVVLICPDDGSDPRYENPRKANFIITKGLIFEVVKLWTVDK